MCHRYDVIVSDRLVAELTAWRTLALQDAFAQSPTTAFAAVLHAFVLASFYFASGARQRLLHRPRQWRFCQRRKPR